MDYTLYEIDKDSKIPVSHQIAELILKNIEAKILVSGDRLPTERELSTRLAVARGTVKAAYKRLEQKGAATARQGSGSFVAKDESLAERLRLQKAKAKLEEAAAELLSAGVSASGIRALLDKSVSRRTSVSIAVISEATELTGSFKAQLSELRDTVVSVFSLDSVTETQDAGNLFSGFDLIVAPGVSYNAATERMPELSDKIIEAAYAASPKTVTSLAPLPRSADIGIVCRTSTFLSIVKDTLTAFGFDKERLTFFFEGGDTALLEKPDIIAAHSGSKALTSGMSGARLLEFSCVIERGSMIYIESKVRELQITDSKKGLP